MLIMAAMKCMETLEAPDIRDVKGFVAAHNDAMRARRVNEANKLYNKGDGKWEKHDMYNMGEGSEGEEGFRLWELDVVEMFPRMDRDKVWEALELVHSLVAKHRKVRGAGGVVKFAVHKWDRKLDSDRLGGGPGDQYWQLDFEDVRKFVRYELYKNDVFTVGGKILRQRLGIAIGGTCSAQLACIYCMAREHGWDGGGWEGLRERVGQYMDPEAISTYPYRFRDNIVGVVRGRVQLATIRKTFEAMYELELQEEGEGLQLPS